jgi:hypothetical protein
MTIGPENLRRYDAPIWRRVGGLLQRTGREFVKRRRNFTLYSSQSRVAFGVTGNRGVPARRLATACNTSGAGDELWRKHM